MKKNKKITSKIGDFRVYAKSHWKRLVAITVILVVLFLGYKKITAEPSGISVATVTRTTLVNDFLANGKVKAKNSADLKFNSPSKVVWLGVKEGDKVRKWQAVAQLDTIPLNAAFEQAQNNYRNYQAAANQVLDSVKGHDTDESFAQNATRTLAEVNRDNAYDAMLAAGDNLKNALLLSPISGTVVDTNDLVAGLNLSGADLEAKYIRIVDLDSFYLEAQVDEVDFSKVKPDQEVSVSVDAYPSQKCKGKVVFINKNGQETTGGVVTIPVEVKFMDCSLDLAIGLNGQAHFELSKIDSALVIPKKYLVNKNDQNYVWLQTGKSTKNRSLIPVKVGTTTLTEAQVLEGVSEGDKVVFIP